MATVELTKDNLEKVVSESPMVIVDLSKSWRVRSTSAPSRH